MRGKVRQGNDERAGIAEGSVTQGRVLILAGTSLARQVCAAVADRDVLASLAGVTQAPAPLGVATRTGGFGGEAGFVAALDGVSALLDATHPFAARITARAVRVCAARGLPYLRLVPPAWPRDPEWVYHADAETCARALPPGARAFLSTGPGSLDPFLGRGLRLWCRRIDPAPAREGVAWITGRPPFAEAEERALLDRLGVTDLVTKASGGGRAKLDAAGALGVAVHVIARPPSPGGEETNDIHRAIAFIRTHAASLPDHRLRR